MSLSTVERRFSDFFMFTEKTKVINILSQHGSVIHIKDMGDSIRASCPCGLLDGDDTVEVSEIVYLRSVKETLNWLGY